MKKRAPNPATEQASRRLAFSVQEAAKAIGISRSSIYLEIGQRRLRVRKIGRRSVISEADLKAWFDALKENGTALHAKLGELLGLDVTPTIPVDEAVMFVCSRLESTVERIAAGKERGCVGEI